MKPNLFEYYINLNERGLFYADVRNVNGESVFEFKTDNNGEIDLITDGYMKHVEDISGLREYLTQVGILNAESGLRFGN